MARPKLSPRFFGKRNFVTSFMMGFTCGAPLLILGSLVQAWLTEARIDIATIGLFALMGLPYSLKFLWAPWLDYLTPPFLGRRRGWMLMAQLALMAALLALSFTDPLDIRMVGLLNFLICFFSATQDVAVDAYRREDLADEELGLGSAYYTWGYRLGMLVISGGGLLLADQVSWPWVFRAVAALMLLGPLTMLFSPEPKPPAKLPRPKSLFESVVLPLRDFFSPTPAAGAFAARLRPTLMPIGWTIMLFILFFKFGDQLATCLNTAFFLHLGYSKSEIGGIVKLVGTWAILLGVALGGYGVLRWGLRKSLWVFGFLQMILIPGYLALALLPVKIVYLAGVILLENLAAGAGTSAFLAFMASLTDRRFTATQYALMTSLMAVPRTVLSAPAGYLVAHAGYESLFIVGTVTALPGFVFLYLLGRAGLFNRAGPGSE